MNETTHKAMADVIDQKILTEENGRRFRKTLKLVLIAFAAVMGIGRFRSDRRPPRHQHHPLRHRHYGRARDH